MGIRDRPTSPRSPWQNGYAERLIGSVRRECVDHIIVLGERHLRHVLLSYMKYYNEVSTHLSLDKDGAGTARRWDRRSHSLPSGPGRAASPICPDLIYDRHIPHIFIPKSHLEPREILISSAKIFATISAISRHVFEMMEQAAN
jgi:hypothetical protein